VLHNLADPIPVRNLPDPYRTRGLVDVSGAGEPACTGNTRRALRRGYVRVCAHPRVFVPLRCAAHRGHCERVFTRAYLLLAGNDTADSDVACRKCFPPSALCRHMLFRRRQESSSTTRAEATAVNYYLPRCFLMGHSADASSDSRQAVRELLAETSL